MQDKLIKDLLDDAVKTFLHYSDTIKENRSLKVEVERLAKLLEDAEADKWFLSERLKLLEGKGKLKKEEAKNNETK